MYKDVFFPGEITEIYYALLFKRDTYITITEELSETSIEHLRKQRRELYREIERLNALLQHVLQYAQEQNINLNIRGNRDYCYHRTMAKIRY